MARMFPERMRSDVKSHAEKRLYQAFKEQLSDDFTVFHQVRWQVRHLNSGARDGEADFAIACPHLGILILEVKGGVITYSGAANKWYSYNQQIQDPFQQACDSKYNLLRRLREQYYWRKRWIPIGHAVAFPDTRIQGRLPLDAPRDIILDVIQLQNLSDWIQAAFHYWRGQDRSKGNFEANSIRELVKILSPSIVSESVLISKIGTEAQELKRLTEEQINILDFLSQQRRVAISGCAGSGKTILALEKACRLNEQGFSVLLTCFNRALAQYLRNQKNIDRRLNMHVYTFHGICEKLFREAGLTLEKHRFTQEELFNRVYPNLLLEAADKLNWRVDAVIVDEGQDICEDWWLALKCLLHEPDNGIFYFFYDDNQNIFDRHWKPPLEEAPFSLTKNCRNTQKIHSYVLQFYSGQNPTQAVGPMGQDVEIFEYDNDPQLKKTLSRLLHHLVVKQGFSHRDIVILTTRRKQTLQNQIIGQFRIKADPDLNLQEILCNTIHYYKGLESPVVILVETERTNANNFKKLLYVGTSRARHHLIVLQPSRMK